MPRNRFNPSNKTALLCTLLAALFLIILGSGCRKETDEFRRRPLSNGKVFIQMGGRKWMIDDSFPSLFSGDNAGKIDPLGKSYLKFDTINGKLCKVIALTCVSESTKKNNVSCNLLIKYVEKREGKWEPTFVNGYISSNTSLPDSIFYCSKILSGEITHTHRLNHTWHQGTIYFEGKPYNSPNSIPKTCIIKFILKS
jgi:hypothetical protein